MDDCGDGSDEGTENCGLINYLLITDFIAVIIRVLVDALCRDGMDVHEDARKQKSFLTL